MLVPSGYLDLLPANSCHCLQCGFQHFIGEEHAPPGRIENAECPQCKQRSLFDHTTLILSEIMAESDDVDEVTVDLDDMERIGLAIEILYNVKFFDPDSDDEYDDFEDDLTGEDFSDEEY